MIQNRACVNGIVAAVLSASIIPLHGALAKEKSPRLQKVIGKRSAPKIERIGDAPNAAAPLPAQANAPSAQ
ncbi:MAG: hypothetical protein ACR652_11900 [Methylocystis sp.]|uniref:hypothetical protein n=1 Tax=Methylocystis sp. TaxID=1911079 RepID=UPI003DA63D56